MVEYESIPNIRKSIRLAMVYQVLFKDRMQAIIPPIIDEVDVNKMLTDFQHIMYNTSSESTKNYTKVWNNNVSHWSRMLEANDSKSIW